MEPIMGQVGRKDRTTARNRVVELSRKVEMAVEERGRKFVASRRGRED